MPFASIHPTTFQRKNGRRRKGKVKSAKKGKD